MKITSWIGGLALAALLAGPAFGAEQDRRRTDAGQAQRGDRGGFGGFGGGMGGPGGMFGRRDAIEQIIRDLGELNLLPQFTLTQEQKERIQAIRDDAKQASEKWRKDHAEELKKLEEDMRSAGRDQDRWRDLGERRTTLYKTAPKAEESAEQIKLALTDDQRKVLDTFQQKKEADAEQQRRQMMERFQNMRGPGGGDRGGAGGAGGAGGNAGGDRNRGGNRGGRPNQ